MFRSRKRSYRKTMDSGEAIALVVLGLLLGTVFTFGEYYWNQPVTREEAALVEAVFSGYKEPKEHKTKLRIGGRRIAIGSDSDITLEFLDHENLVIDERCVNDTLLKQLQTIKSGDDVLCLVHPNSSTVLEISVNNALLLSFDDTVSRVHSERRGFFVLGVIMYIGVMCGLLYLLPKRRICRRLRRFKAE